MFEAQQKNTKEPEKLLGLLSLLNNFRGYKCLFALLKNAKLII